VSGWNRTVYPSRWITPDDRHVLVPATTLGWSGLIAVTVIEDSAMGDAQRSAHQTRPVDNVPADDAGGGLGLPEPQVEPTTASKWVIRGSRVCCPDGSERSSH